MNHGIFRRKVSQPLLNIVIKMIKIIKHIGLSKCTLLLIMFLINITIFRLLITAIFDSWLMPYFYDDILTIFHIW